MIPRFFIENYGSDKEVLTVFLGEAFKFSLLNSTNMTLLIPSKKDYEKTVVGEILGQKNVKNLCQGNTLSFDGVIVDLEIASKVSTRKTYGLVLGIYLTQYDLEYLDRIISAKAIAYIPWLEQEGKEWANKWSPTIWSCS